MPAIVDTVPIILQETPSPTLAPREIEPFYRNGVEIPPIRELAHQSIALEPEDDITPGHSRHFGPPDNITPSLSWLFGPPGNRFAVHPQTTPQPTYAP